MSDFVYSLGKKLTQAKRLANESPCYSNPEAYKFAVAFTPAAAQKRPEDEVSIRSISA
jgi:hypothetical protein